MKGHLVIADISGYTQFLTESELDHANGIVGDLLSAIIGAIQAPLTVSSIEGDAVFMYGQAPDDMSGQAIIESVELLYGAFAGALERMVVNTTCTCNACVNIRSLGLKIVMHCGEYATTTVAGITTLSGPDVIAVHRLLKNRIVEDTGIQDYLMVTQQCVDDLGIAPLVASWTPHTETYDHVGEIGGYVSSLREAWESERLRAEVLVPPDEAWDTLEMHAVAPPAIVWDHLMDPAKRTRWITVADDTAVEHRVEGRIGPGTEYHCAHGDHEIGVFTILDMRANDYCTIMSEFVDGSFLTYTWYLRPVEGGTALTLITKAPHDAEGEPIVALATEDVRAGWHAASAENAAILATMAREAAASLVPAP